MTPLLAAALVARIAIADLDRPAAEIELRLPRPASRLCLDRNGAGKHVSGLKADPDDSDCFLAEGTDVRYRVDLRAMSSRSWDPDGAVRVEGGLIASDHAFLLRPSRFPPETEVEIAFSLPKGIEVAAPWTRVGQGRFKTTMRQRRSGSYVAIGKLRSLGDLAIDGGVVHPVIFAGETRAGDEALKSWLRDATSAVARFYRGLPCRDLHVVIAPSRRSARPGIFGSVLRENFASAVLYVGADAEPASFRGEWLAFHELFHLGNPMLAGRVPWFTEGVATYYQDVLRARAGVKTADEMWADLEDGLRRFCAPEGRGTFLDRVRQLQRDREYREYYWGAACWAFRLDVRVRQASGGKASLDTVVREVRARSMRERLDEGALLALLDELTSGAAGDLSRTAGSLYPADLTAIESVRRAIFAPQ